MEALNEVALGSIILVLAGVITLTVLPIANAAIASYAAGPDGVLASTADNPPSSQVSLLNLFPLVIIAALVIAGVAFLVSGFKHVKA